MPIECATLEEISNEKWEENGRKTGEKRDGGGLESCIAFLRGPSPCHWGNFEINGLQRARRMTQVSRQFRIRFRAMRRGENRGNKRRRAAAPDTTMRNPFGRWRASTPASRAPGYSDLLCLWFSSSRRAINYPEKSLSFLATGCLFIYSEGTRYMTIVI